MHQASLTQIANDAANDALEEKHRADKKAAEAIKEKQRVEAAELETSKRIVQLAEVSNFQEKQLSQVDPEKMGQTISDSITRVLDESPDADQTLSQLSRVNFTDVARDSKKDWINLTIKTIPNLI